MRITNKMLSNSFLSDMRTNLSNMQQLQKQMSTGKEISKPSDDPFKVARSMQLNSDITSNGQYNSNIKDTINWLSTTDTALGQVGDDLQRIRELMVSAGDASYGPSEKKAIKDEINQRVGQLSQNLNTNFEGKYIFGGTRGTDKPTDTVVDGNSNTKLVFYGKSGLPLNIPFSSDSPTGQDKIEYDMIAGNLNTEISQGVTMDYNVSANQVIKFTSSGNSCDLRQLLTNIENHLDGNNDDGSSYTADAAHPENSPSAKLTGTDLQQMTDAINNVLSIRSEVGAKQNRMESAKSQNEDNTNNLTEILSKTEDIDITQKTMEYATMQTVYIASLQAGAKVIQPSLLDYLR